MPTYSTLIPRHDVETMAKKYDAALDEFDYISDAELRTFRQLINMQFSDISKRVQIEFVDYEPYGENPKLNDMLVDFRKGIMKIHTTGNESRIWGKFHNLQFRAIHDYIHLIQELDFTHADEVKVYPKQFEFSLNPRYTEVFPYLNWETYKRILRSEIVYQSAYKEAFGKFHIDQKIILEDL
jgi:hypothetical protein